MPEVVQKYAKSSETGDYVANVTITAADYGLDVANVDTANCGVYWRGVFYENGGGGYLSPSFNVDNAAGTVTAVFTVPADTKVGEVFVIKYAFV